MTDQYCLFRSGPTLQCASVQRIKELTRAGLLVVLSPSPSKEAVEVAESSVYKHSWRTGDNTWHTLEETKEG
jgi:hypothetical protein